MNYRKNQLTTTHLKLLRKLILVLFICSVFQGTLHARSQNDLFTMHLKEVTVKEFIKEVRKQSGFKFFYKNDEIDLNKKINVHVEKASIEMLLEQAFLNTGINFKIVNQQIILTQKLLISSSNKSASVSYYSKEKVLVKGKVTNAENGDPIPGATVLEKGTLNGTVTNLDGDYNLTVSVGSTLVFSFIGMVEKQIVVSGNTEINVALEPKTEELDEVVVVGYGTQKARNITGSISSIDGETLSSQPTSSLDAGLQGLTTGIHVSQASGVPGGATRVMIRGTSSISSGTEPLYIIDGIPIWQDVNGNIRNENTGGASANTQSPLADINSNDIASVQILKDAAATAIYGARGANGVIIITTKSGKQGEKKLSFSYQQGVTTPVKVLEYANTKEWFRMVDASRYNTEKSGAFIGENGVPVSDFVPFTYNINTTPVEWSRLRAQYTDVNHLKSFLSTGKTREANLSASNGTELTSYYISLNYKNEEGIAIGNTFNRYNGRANIDLTPHDKLRVGTRISVSHIDNNRAMLGASSTNNVSGQQNRGATGGFWAANRDALPMFPIYNDDGGYFDPRSGRNVIAGSDRDHVRDNVKQYRMIGQLFGEYKPFDKLTIRGEASLDYVNTDQIFWVSGLLRTVEDDPSPMAYDLNRLINTTTYVAYATYNENFFEKHDIILTLGTEATETLIRSRDNQFENLNSIDQEPGEFGESTSHNALRLLSGINDNKKYLGYFSRLNYIYNDKYLLNLSFRRDGASVFAREKKFTNFYAASGGWILTAEPFMENLDALSFLKLRASYGTTGNDKISSGFDVEGYVTWPTYWGASSLSLLNLANNQLTWEISKQTDAGFEFGLFRNRISGSVAYYNNFTKDMLLSTPVAPSIGISQGNFATINVGDMRNWGVEAELTTVNIHNLSSGFKWSTSINFTTNNNKILRLTEAIQGNPLGIEGSRQLTSTRINGRLAAFYLAEYAGIDNQGYETIYEIDQELVNEGRYVKTGNIIRATENNIKNNRIVHEDKTGLPTWFGGITNTLFFKGFELSIFINGQGGNYLYDKAEEEVSYVSDGSKNILRKVYDNSWTENNTDASYPLLLWNNQQAPASDNGEGSMGTSTTRFLYKGDYLRLRNLTVAYNLPATFINRLGLSKLRIFVTGHNLATLSGYEGYDPEVLNLGSSEERNLGQGIIRAYNLPLIRSFTGGFNLSF